MNCLMNYKNFMMISDFFNKKLDMIKINSAKNVSKHLLLLVS